jgi:hypothetical protein
MNPDCITLFYGLVLYYLWTLLAVIKTSTFYYIILCKIINWVSGDSYQPFINRLAPLTEYSRSSHLLISSPICDA